MKITLKFCNDSWIKFLFPDVVLVIHKICIITCSAAKRQSNSEPSSKLFFNHSRVWNLGISVYLKLVCNNANSNNLPDLLCHSSPSKSREICAQKYWNRSRDICLLVKILMLCYIIPLFKYILKQLFTTVSVAIGGYLPRHFTAW